MAEVILDIESQPYDDLHNPNKQIPADHRKSSEHIDLALISFGDRYNLIRGKHVEGSTQKETSDRRENEDKHHIEWQGIEEYQTSSDDDAGIEETVTFDVFVQVQGYFLAS